MIIKFYSTNSDKRQLHKTLTEVVTLNGDIKQDTSILTPIINIAYNTEILSSNYCYIEDFDRYYFITDIQASKNYIVIKMKNDVLMSFSTEIDNLTCNIIKQENIGFSNLIDKDISILSDSTTEVVEFTASCLNLTTADNNSNNFIITIAGG